MQSPSSDDYTLPENIQEAHSGHRSKKSYWAKRKKMTKTQRKQEFECDLKDKEYGESEFDQATEKVSMENYYHESTLSAPGFKSKKALSAIRKEEEARALTKRIQKMPGWHKDMYLDPENLPIPEYLRVIKKKLEKDQGGQRRFHRKKAKKDTPSATVLAGWDIEQQHCHIDRL